jgi:lipoyl synthase
VTVSAPTSGFALRQQHFPPTMEFYAPGLKRWQSTEWRPSNPRQFLPVSVTGTACALKCDHCFAGRQDDGGAQGGAKVLDGMLTMPAGETLFDLAARLARKGTRGLLLSGGSTRSGGVPLIPHLRHLPRIQSELGMKVIVHSGVVDPTLAAALANAGVDGVMLDIIGARETIRDVYHLDLTPDDFSRALGLLAERDLRIIPHIVCGLHYGQFLGEHHALEMIARHPVSTVIIVVLVPLIGTAMEHIPPPPVADVTEFMAAARQALPTTPVNLGCARPMGGVKVELDQAAIDAGLNGIAYPSDGAIAYARSRGLEPALYEYCCSLTWAGEDGEGFATASVEDLGGPA